MAKLNDDEILSIVAYELRNANGSTYSDVLQGNRRDALATYLGEPGIVDEGKSSFVSTDVADAIEWILPEIIKAFTQNNDVVTFDPVSAQDKPQAEMESQFVYDVLMKDNDGFIILHNFIKDALLQKNGFIKVFYDNQDRISKEAYTGLTEMEVQYFQADPTVEITGLTETVLDSGIASFDINIIRRELSGKVEVVSIAPEDFRVNYMHNSVNIDTARFCAHVMAKTKSELIEDGYDRKIIDELPESSYDYEEKRTYRFSMQGENTQFNVQSKDPSQVLYDVSECYLLIDIDGDGIAERCKITVAGIDDPTHILEVEEVDCWPFVSATAIMMSHKLFGLSIYDRLKEIQAQKTTLVRNMFENIYLKNNQRTVVLEGQVNLDDVLVSRPGGIIRAKNPNAVIPLQTPDLSGDAYRMMDYLDQVRAGRSGVSPEGSIHDSAMGDSVGSQGLEQLLTQKEELVGLMVRVFAETGIRPLCYKIRDLLVQHKDTTTDYEFHGEWQQVVPSTWQARTRSTVRVGTGSGNRKEQAAAIMTVLSFQEKILANPQQALVSESNVFNALNDFAKFSGMPGAATYFLDPNSPEGKEKKQQVDQSAAEAQKAELEEKQLLAQTQTKIANAEESKARTAEQNVQLQWQVQQSKQELEAYKQQADLQIKTLQQQLAENKQVSENDYKTGELNFRYYDSDQRAAIERERIAASMANKPDTSTGEKNDRSEESKAGD